MGCIPGAAFPICHSQIVLTVAGHATQLLRGHILIYHGRISQNRIQNTFVAIFIIDQAQHILFFHYFGAPEEIFCHVHSPTGKLGAILTDANERITVLCSHHIVEGLPLLQFVAISHTGILIAIGIEELNTAAITAESEDSAGGCAFQCIAYAADKVFLHRNTGPLCNILNRLLRNRHCHQFLGSVKGLRHDDIISQFIVIAAFHPAFEAVAIENRGYAVISGKAIPHRLAGSAQYTDAVIFL